MAKMPEDISVNVTTNFFPPWEPLHEANQPPIDSVVLVGWSPDKAKDVDHNRLIDAGKVTDKGIRPVGRPKGFVWRVFPDYWAWIEPPKNFGENPGDEPWMPDHERELKRMLPDGYRIVEFAVSCDKHLWYRACPISWEISLKATNNDYAIVRSRETTDHRLVEALVERYKQDLSTMHQE